MEEGKKEINEPADWYATYDASHYLKWTFEGYVELIRGKIFKMSPPGQWAMHQAAAGYLFGEMYDYFKERSCELFISPFAVFLTHDADKWRETQNVVQPDLCIVCNSEQITRHGCIGAPALVIEVLSPTTAKKDRTLKLDLYEEYGVDEYWMIDPKRMEVLVSRMGTAGMYEHVVVFEAGQFLSPRQFKDVVINTAELFSQQW